MEYTLKKKTKNFIALRTNNYIQTEIQKQNFFNEVLNSLQKQLDPKEFQFLTTYLLFQQNNTHKRQKHETKLPTQNKIMTQPDQRPFNISDIDPSLFQQNYVKKDNILPKRTSIGTKQFDFHCTTTPKRKLKHIVFENKRILDLDKKLNQKYQDSRNSLVYTPNFLTIESRQNRNRNKFLIKTSYQNSIIKRKNPKPQMRRLKTSFASTRQDIMQRCNSTSRLKERASEFASYGRERSLRYGQMQQTAQTQRNRHSQNSIPKYLMEQVLLTRRSYNQFSNDFSDFKLNKKYKECFS